MKRAVVQIINMRLGNAGRAREVSGAEVAVDLYGQLLPEEVEEFKRLISTRGMLEFRILPTAADSNHKPIIVLAEQLSDDRNSVRLAEREVARWVQFSPDEFGDADQARSRGLIVRMVGDTPQALALVNDGLDVTSKYVRSAAEDLDETGRPQVRFNFNAEGAFKFGQLTGNHVPARAGITYQLGILLDKRLLSAPTIQSKITSSAVISGGAMDEQEVRDMVAILNAGALPLPIKLINVSTPQQGE
jgi:preprotein translocase subunit SecD